MAKQKRKVAMPAGIRNKMMAAVSMLLVSSIMMVSSTYAWFTLSTAPEVKNISTTVAGNGSLEIALMPESGLLGDIRSGFSGDTANGGNVALPAANITWGNIINLSDPSYGLNSVNLNPASLNLNEAGTGFVDETKPLAIATYGYDGRIDNILANTVLKDYADGAFNGPGYGVRAIGEDDGSGKLGSTYGYAIDLAFRLNSQSSTVSNGQTSTSDGKLLLQTDAIQRIYNDATSADGVSRNSQTMGGGSYMSFNANGLGLDLETLMSSVRITFVQNYGLADTAESTAPAPIVLGTAMLDMSKKVVGANETTAPLYLYSVSGTGEEINATPLTGTNAVLVPQLTKNAATQITAIVWLDGNFVKNSSVAAVNTALAQATLNLQFSTDVQLKPASNNALFEGNAS